MDQSIRARRLDGLGNRLVLYLLLVIACQCQVVALLLERAPFGSHSLPGLGQLVVWSSTVIQVLPSWHSLLDDLLDLLVHHHKGLHDIHLRVGCLLLVLVQILLETRELLLEHSIAFSKTLITALLRMLDSLVVLILGLLGHFDVGRGAFTCRKGIRLDC